jgi:hypothetical protein
MRCIAGGNCFWTQWRIQSSVWFAFVFGCVGKIDPVAAARSPFQSTFGRSGHIKSQRSCNLASRFGQSLLGVSRHFIRLPRDRASRSAGPRRNAPHARIWCTRRGARRACPQYRRRRRSRGTCAPAPTPYSSTPCRMERPRSRDHSSAARAAGSDQGTHDSPLQPALIASSGSGLANCQRRDAYVAILATSVRGLAGIAPGHEISRADEIRSTGSKGPPDRTPEAALDWGANHILARGALRSGRVGGEEGACFCPVPVISLVPSNHASVAVTEKTTVLPCAGHRAGKARAPAGSPGISLVFSGLPGHRIMLVGGLRKARCLMIQRETRRHVPGQYAPGQGSGGGKQLQILPL